MTGKIFRSTLAASLTVLLASLLVITGCLYTYFGTVREQQLQTELTLAAAAVEADGADYLARVRDTAERLTWVASDGTVLYDTRTDTQPMENHGQREEIREALTGGSGSSARYSETLTEKMLYQAVRLTDGSVLRISGSQKTVWMLVLGMLHAVIVVALLAVGLSALLASRAARRVVEPLNRLDLEHPLDNNAYEELSPLLGRVYAQQQEIRHQEEVITKLKSFNREKSIKRAESREKMLDKIERLEKPTQANDSMDIRLEPDVVSGNDVLTVTDLSKSFDTQTLFTNVDFEIKRGERVAIIGNNGTGKTTLLKIINGIIPADSGQIRLGSKVHIGYYDQEHQVLHMDKTLFDELQDTYPDMNNTQIRNVLAAFLFTGDDVFKRIRDLSGGERGRVSLAKLMLSEANFLILDEPTNHLDIASKEILENALVHYTGTVLYVSHDRYFINKTATRILDLTMGTLINYIGNYDYYLEKKETQEKAYLASAAQAANRSAKSPGAGNAGTSSHLTAAAGANPTALSGNGTGTSAASSASAVTAAVQAAASASSGKLDWKQQKEEQTRLRKKQNELKRVEEEIHTLETRDQEIDALLCDETVFSDVPRLMELNKEKEELNAKLEGLYEKWEELAE